MRRECRCGCTDAVKGDAVPPHGPRLLCRDCGAFLGWEKKTKAARRATNHRELVSRHNLAACEVCGRTRDELRSAGVALHAHHVVEYHLGGSDDRSNIWALCSPCHEIVHAIRKALHPTHPPPANTVTEQRTAADDAFDREWGG